MKAHRKTLMTLALATVTGFILAGEPVLTSGAEAGGDFGQDQLVSGEPYRGFFEEVAAEAPGNLMEDKGQGIIQGSLSVSELAALYPEAFVGQVELEADGELTAIAKAR